MSRVYLDAEDVVELHAELIARYGGSAGVRDANAIEAAVHRPRSGYYDDLIAEAAALFESLAINHPFVDGNKRVAFAALDIFLRLNGSRLDARPMDIHVAMMAMFESGTFDREHVEAWLRGIVVS